MSFRWRAHKGRNELLLPFGDPLGTNCARLHGNNEELALRRRHGGIGVTLGERVRRGVVLVIDDDEGVRTVMAAALEDAGWWVETAQNGQLALEKVARISPDIIILDLRMPIMDGLTFADRYRALEGMHAPIVLISATVSDAEARRTGAVAFLRKPTDLVKLLDTVEQHATSDGFR